MKRLRAIAAYFSGFELILWFSSILLILSSFCIFDRSSFLTLLASLLGVTAILLNAKGSPIGQVLMIIFSLIYGCISYDLAYYGEMATYLGMTMPMAVFALVAWLRHPYNGNKNEVEVNHLAKGELIFMVLLSLPVTVIFYFILEAFNTANIIPSTFSVTTSFIAVYLTFRRSPYFSLAYAFNDLVLLVLWSLAGLKDSKYLSVLACFLAFLFNDLYAFISWRRMEKRQRTAK
ncbi:MAG: nicotinamide mononucleotide transporter [Treponema sp.]|nr:nicotinamide mononucleotide transporter [Treponema sp.]